MKKDMTLKETQDFLKVLQEEHDRLKHDIKTLAKYRAADQVKAWRKRKHKVKMQIDYHKLREQAMIAKCSNFHVCSELESHHGAGKLCECLLVKQA